MQILKHLLTHVMDSLHQFQVNYSNIISFFHKGKVLSIPYICCVFLLPIFGKVVDRIGFRAELLLVSCLINTSVFSIWLI